MLQNSRNDGHRVSKVARIHRRTVQKNLHDQDNHDGVITHLESPKCTSAGVFITVAKDKCHLVEDKILKAPEHRTGKL